MTNRNSGFSLIRIAFSALGGAILGGFLGFASAQAQSAGQLDAACVGRCNANSHDAEFCNEVCWIPDPAAAAKGDNLDWKCFETCRERGGRAEPCMASCRRY